MKLLGATLHGASGSLGAPVQNARASWSRREGVLLRLSDDGGRSGVGEASPLPGYSPDTLVDCVAALERVEWGALPEFRLDAPVLPQVAAVVERVDARLPAARFAVETALLDVIGQARGTSVPRLLGARLDARAPLCALLSSDTVKSQGEETRRLLRVGLGSFKRKLSGENWTAQLDLLRAFRRDAGPVVTLRLDVNGSWSAVDAPARLEALRELSPEWVEEPVGNADFTSLARSPVPLAADESLQDPRRWGPVLEGLSAISGAAVVLKPMALGGVATCLELARRARQRGLKAAVSHVFDGPVALAACAALALALPEQVTAHGLTPHPGLKVWPETALPFVRSGELISWETPGLGLGEVAR